MKKKAGWKDILALEVVFLVYSFASIAQKWTANYEMLSKGYIISMGVAVLLLGIYALLWQQVIKKFELSVAYANKAICLLWALLWAAFLFKEEITPKKVIAIVVVMVGIYVLNSKGKGEE